MQHTQVGGLDHYIRALKEMIFLPLTYPELFARFGLNPPRGVLLYGPPGVSRRHMNAYAAFVWAVLLAHHMLLMQPSVLPTVVQGQSLPHNSERMFKC